MTGDKGVRTLPERRRLRVRRAPGGQRDPPVRYWIDALQLQLTTLASKLTRPWQADGVNGTKSHVAQLAAFAVAKHPRLRAAVRDAQIQTTAIGVQPFALQFLHPER